MRLTALLSMLTAAFWLAAAASVEAQTVEQFYRNRNVALVIPNAPGGSFDLYARLAATHLGRFLPGHPNIVPQNMPGAGGMLAANYLYGVAPKDGGTLGILVPNIALAQVLSVQSITYDVRRFNWVGRLIATTALLYSWHSSGTRTLADLKNRETLIASTGPLSQADINSAMLNGVVGTKFKIVRGYQGTQEAALAVERGEVDAAVMPWEFLKVSHADWLKDHKVTIVARYVRRPNPELPQVPSIFELAETQEQRGVFNLFFGPDEIGQPIVIPPDVPPERVAALRAAFAEMIKDPEFLADAQKRNLELRPAGREELEKVVAEAFEATPQEIEIARKYFR